MTKKTRIILLFICLFLFLIVASLVVLFSQGYRIDLAKRKITQTGAFYFKVWPKSVQIYLTPLDSEHLTGQDGKLAKKTDFFFGAVFIDNLLPKKYTVEIKKEGFHSWKKTLEIKEKQVTDAKNVVLVSESPKFNILTTKVDDFFLSPDEKKIILKEVNEKGWALKLFDLKKNVKSHLIEDRDISKTDVNLLDLKFSADSKRILLKVGSDGNLKHFLLDSTPRLISLDFEEENIEDVYFHPENPQKLFLFKKGRLFEKGLTKEGASLPLLENILVFQISEKNIYYLDNSGILFKTDFTFSPKEKIAKVSLPLEKDLKYRIDIVSNKIFLQDNQNLFLFDPQSGTFEKISEAKEEFKPSADFRKLVYFSDYEIWVLFLKPESNQPQKSIGERLFIARFSEKRGRVFWYTSHYLIFNVGNEIKIVEIDDRDRINIVDLAEFKNPRIFFNQVDKKLYILSEGNLYSSERLLP